MDYLHQLVFIAVFDLFDRLPSFIFYVLALLSVLLLQQFFLLLQPPNLFIFGFFLHLVLDSQLFQVFLLNQVQLRDAIVEPFLLLLLLVEQLLVTFVVRVHLLFVLAFLQF